jgi:hypothetical protein
VPELRQCRFRDWPGEFASIVDAVACAVAIQRAMLAFNAGIHVDRQIVRARANPPFLRHNRGGRMVFPRAVLV